MDIGDFPNDILRRVYAQCLNVKHADNRAAAVDRVAGSILDAIRTTYIDEGTTERMSFPGLGDVRIQVDAYKGSRAKRAFAITATADGHEPIVYGMMFMRRGAEGAWTLTTGPFGTTAGASSLAFAGLRDFMDDVAKSVEAKYALTPSRTFDRRALSADVVQAKIVEVGAEAAAAHFGVSAYRLRRLVS